MRRSPRLKIDGRCMILVGGKPITAELKDIAPSGLGVICRHPLPENQSLTVVMEDGRRLTAKIVNRSADRVGLMFEAQLRRDDPLFHRTG
jgi:PilZ domain